MKLELK